VTDRSFQQRAKWIAACALLATCADSALAASEVQGRIVEISVDRNLAAGAVFIRLDKSPAPIAACSTNGYWHYTLPQTGDIDKRQFAMLLAAQAAGSTVFMIGSGSCNEFGSVESATRVDIKTQ
jgi:hypothetical protein